MADVLRDKINGYYWAIVWCKKYEFISDYDAIKKGLPFFKNAEKSCLISKLVERVEIYRVLFQLRQMFVRNSSTDMQPTDRLNPFTYT